MTDISANAEIADKFNTENVDVPDLTEAAKIADALGPDYPIKLHFRLDGILYEVMIEMDGDHDEALMNLRAIVNKLPFTSENPEKRQMLKSLLRSPDPNMPGRLFMDKANRILFEMKTRLDTQQPKRAPELAATGYMTAIVICLMQARPYLSTFRV